MPIHSVPYCTQESNIAQAQPTKINYSWEVKSYPRTRIRDSSDCSLVINWTTGLHTRWPRPKCLIIFLYLPRRPPKNSFLLIRCWAKTFLGRRILIWFNSGSNKTNSFLWSITMCKKQNLDLDGGIRHVRKDVTISSFLK